MNSVLFSHTSPALAKEIRNIVFESVREATQSEFKDTLFSSYNLLPDQLFATHHFKTCPIFWKNDANVIYLEINVKPDPYLVVKDDKESEIFDFWPFIQLFGIEEAFTLEVVSAVLKIKNVLYWGEMKYGRVHCKKLYSLSLSSAPTSSYIDYKAAKWNYFKRLRSVVALKTGADVFKEVIHASSLEDIEY